MKARDIAKRYRSLIIAVLIFVVFIIAFPGHAKKATNSLMNQLLIMLMVVPPIFLLLGLLDAWVPKEVLMRFMGHGSGLKGVILAFALGSAATGPLYGAFPVAAVLMRKGASFTNILIFVGAWSTTKIPMFLFEMNSLGTVFALSRLLIDIPGIIIIATALRAVVPKHEIDRLYKKAGFEDAES